MKSRPPLLRLLDYSKKYKWKFRRASLYSVLNKIFDICPEILIGIAIDVVVSQEKSFLARAGISDPWQQILILGVLTLFIWVFESLFEYLYKINWRELAQLVQHELRIDAYNHIQNLDMKYFEDKSTGNLVSILNDDINQLERFLDDGVNQLLHTLTSVIGVGIVFFAISYQIAFFAFTPIPIVIAGSFYFQKRASRFYSSLRQKAGDIAARLSNNISGIVTIKSFTREGDETKKLNSDSISYLEANKKAIAVSSAFIPIIRMAILAGFMATFLMGGWMVLNGELNVGLYGLLVFLTQRLLWPLTGLATTVDLYERAMASTKRVMNLIETRIHILSGDDFPKKLNGDLIFRNVGFVYPNEHQVFEKLNLEIKAAKTTAFVGSTGSGKSSLVKLILRFYEIQKGQILLDHKDLNSYNIEAIRSLIGLVSQDVFLFHGSILENIAYGKKNASKKEIIQAARLAEAHTFIENCPQKYATIIGERGMKLSGGQRQRIALARAIIKNPDILILDEATSSVDNETEAAIQRSIAKISKNRTTIIIAHRLSTIVHADTIYVLEKGKIKEKGTHRGLLKKNGFYKKLWQVQTGGH